MPPAGKKSGENDHQRRLRFILAGGLNTAIGLSFFPVILWISPWLYKNYMVGLILSQITCTIIAFAIHKFLVFRTGRVNVLREFYAFASFYLFNYAVNIAALPALVGGLGMSPIIAQVGFSVIVVVGSYFWHSHVTFKSSTRAG